MIVAQRFCASPGFRISCVCFGVLLGACQNQALDLQSEGLGQSSDDDRCVQVEALSADAYPDLLVKGHAEARIDSGYAARIRKAARLAQDRIWQSAEAEISGRDLGLILVDMYCNYQGESQRTPLRSVYLRSPPPIMRVTYGTWYAAVRKVYAAAGLEDLVDFSGAMQSATLEDVRDFDRPSLVVSYPLLPGDSSFSGVDPSLLPREIYSPRQGMPPRFERFEYISSSILPELIQEIAVRINALRNLHRAWETAQPVAIDRKHELAQLIPAVASLQAELAFLLAHLHPFANPGNWSIGYILVAQARQLFRQLEPDLFQDRMSEGLDLLLLLGPRTRLQAIEVYDAWQQGLFEQAFYSDAGVFMRRYPAAGTIAKRADQIATYAAPMKFAPKQANISPLKLRDNLQQTVTWSQLHTAQPLQARQLWDGFPESGRWLAIWTINDFGESEVRLVHEDVAAELAEQDYTFLLDDLSETFLELAWIQLDKSSESNAVTAQITSLVRQLQSETIVSGSRYNSIVFPMLLRALGASIPSS